tara:strand:+ start:767 stop:964 length:198 start_codon:yes stop_codon:yes gene_type:complete
MTTDREQRPLTEQQLVDSRLNEIQTQIEQLIETEYIGSFNDIQTQIEQLIETVYLMGYNNGLKQS